MRSDEELDPKYGQKGISLEGVEEVTGWLELGKNKRNWKEV